MMNRIADHARNNRRNPTEPEVRLWRHLSNRQLDGLEFRRQHAVDGRILDVVCPAIALGIDVDGDTHDPEAYRIRDAHLHHDHGITIIHVTNPDVTTNMEGVLLTILDCARALPSRWAQSGVLHPNPSSEEEGL